MPTKLNSAVSSLDFALGDDRVEAVVDLGGQQVAQRFPVAMRVSGDDGLVSDLRARQERPDLERRIGGRDLAQRLQRSATRGHAAQPLIDALATRIWLGRPDLGPWQGDDIALAFAGRSSIGRRIGVQTRSFISGLAAKHASEPEKNYDRDREK